MKRTLTVEAEITETGQLLVELPPDAPRGSVVLTLEVALAEEEPTDEDLRGLGLTAEEIVASPEIGSWVDVTAEQFRARLQYEDGLLYTRFNLVLVVNGFAAVAVGFNQPIASKILLAVIMVVLNALGAIAVWKTEMVIAALTKRYRHDYPHDPIESIVQEPLGKSGWLRPNQILCRLFPVVLTLGWICGLVLGVFALMRK